MGTCTGGGDKKVKLEEDLNPRITITRCEQSRDILFGRTSQLGAAHVTFSSPASIKKYKSVLLSF